jgi:MFS family permease
VTRRLVPSDAAPEGVASPSERMGRRWLELAAATVSQFGASVTQQGTIILAVFFAGLYSLTLSQMGVLVSSLTLGLVVSGLGTGLLVDLYGPRRVLLIGNGILTGVALVIGLVRNLPSTVVLLFLLGVALGVVPMSGTKALLMSWPREQRGFPMGVRQMGVPAGALAAALVLPTLAPRTGVYPLYWLFALLLAICGWVYGAMLPRRTQPPDEVVAGGLRLRQELRPIAVPMLSAFLLGWGQYLLTTYTIPMLRTETHLALPLAGLVLAMAQVGGAGGRIVLGALSDRLGGSRAVVLLATTLGATLLTSVMAIVLTPASVPLLIVLWLAMGITMIGWNALMLTWAGERVSVGNAGAAMGLTTSAVLAGATVCAPAIGLIVQVSGTYRTAWVTLAALLTCAVLLLAREARREMRRGVAQTGPAPASQ